MKKVTNSAELAQPTEAKALVPKIVEHPVRVEAANMAEALRQVQEGIASTMRTNPDDLSKIESVTFTLTPVVTMQVEVTVIPKN